MENKKSNKVASGTDIKMRNTTLNSIANTETGTDILVNDSTLSKVVNAEAGTDINAGVEADMGVTDNVAKRQVDSKNLYKMITDEDDMVNMQGS